MTGSAGQRWARVLLVGAITAGGAVAQKASMTDAQVEANVLRALASAPELSTQNIQSTSVYGTVTLSGNVHDEAARTKAENLVARAEGVKKVIDEMTLGDTPAPAVSATGDSGGPPTGEVLQSDGSYAPAPPEAVNQANPDGPAARANSGAPANSNQPYGANNQTYGSQGASPGTAGTYPGQQPYSPNGNPPQYAGQPGYPQASQPGYPQASQPSYSQGYPAYPQTPNGQRPYYGQSGETGGGQAAGVAVTRPERGDAAGAHRPRYRLQPHPARSCVHRNGAE